MIKPRVLLIDDDRDTTDGLERILTNDGYPVTAVSSGYEALSLLSRKDYDIIVTDMDLPGIGGLTLIHELRKMNVHRAIVVVTACDSVKMESDAIEQGVAYYLTKPVNVVALVLILENLWEKQRMIAPCR